MKPSLSVLLCGAALVLSAPGPVFAQWENLGLPGPEGCQIYDIAVAGNDLFVSTDFGIFRSGDDGRSWVPAGFTDEGKRSPFPHLYSAGQSLVAINNYDLYITTDRGASWSKVRGAGLSEDSCCWHFVEKDGMFFVVMGEAGVYSSADQGANWISCGPELPGDWTISHLAVFGSDLFAGGWDGRIVRSRDNGAHWTDANSGVPDGDSADLLVASANRLFLLKNGAIFVWQEIDEVWKPVELVLEKGASVRWIAANGPCVLMVLDAEGEDITLISTDGGTTWKEAGNFRLEDVLAWCIAGKGDSIFVGTEVGLLRSGDLGNTWVAANSGFPSGTKVHSLARIGKILFGANDDEYGVLFTRDDTVGGWQALKTTPFDNADIECLAAVGKNLLAGIGYGIYLSRDLGRSWIKAAIDPVCRPWVDFIEVMGTRAFAGTDKGLFLSTDWGRSWSAVETGLPASARILCLAGSGDDIFLGTSEGVFVSRGAGAAWRPLGLGLPQGADCEFLAMAGRSLVCSVGVTRGERSQSGKAFLSEHESSLFRSSDGGKTWTAAAAGLPEKYRLKCLVSIGSHLFTALRETSYSSLAKNLGLFFSSDGGRTWSEVGLARHVEKEIVCLLAGEDEIFAGMYGLGVWRLPLAALKKRLP